jgi:DNA (cytosine-5)-methyltransferase 1
MTLRVLDLFSGIGGFSLGLERAGMRTVGFCEIDPFCREVLAKHWPDVPCHDNVTTREFQEGEADVICGGFPCQDVSLAGRRAGLAGKRSGLYRELVRALRVVRPRYGIVENVAALLSDGMGTVLGDLATIGFDTEWDCVPACALGAPHERDRVWIVAHADSERCGEAGQFRHRPFEMSSGGIEALTSAYASSDSNGFGRESGTSDAQQSRPTIHDIDGQHSCAAFGRSDVESRFAGSVASDVDGERCEAEGHSEKSRRGCESADPPRLGCGQGRMWRPPDSFARVRDEARRNAADPYGARLAFREGISRDAWEELSAAERDALWNGEQQIWPDEPALSGVDDEIPDWLDRTKSTGNAIIPQIPELIGLAILSAHKATDTPPHPTTPILDSTHGTQGEGVKPLLCPLSTGES